MFLSKDNTLRKNMETRVSQKKKKKKWENK